MLPDGLQDAANDEDVVEDCHTGQEAVKDAAHLPAQEDGDGHCVRHEAQAAKGDLSHALQPPRHGQVHHELE